MADETVSTDAAPPQPKLAGKVVAPPGNSTKQSSVHAAARALGGPTVKDVVAAVDAARAPKAQTPDAQAVEPPAASRSADAAGQATQSAQEADTPAAAEPAVDPREGRMLSDVRQRERKLVEDRQRFRREQDEFKSYRTKAEAELTGLREQATLAQRDPLAWLEKYHGIRREAFGAVGAKPEEVQQNVALERVMAELNTVKGELQSEKQARAQAATEARRSAELDKFAAEAKTNESRWPLAARYTRLKERGWEIALTHAQEGATLSNEEVLDKLEEELSSVVPKKSPAAPKKPESAPQARPAQPAQPALQSRGQSDTDATPVSPLKLTREQMIQRSVAAIEEAKRARLAK